MINILILFSMISNGISIWAIKRTLKVWLPKMKALEKDAEALKMELWLRK